MNPRIRELAEQARVQDRGYFIYQYDDHQSVEKAINLEKFAELIVRECARVADQWVDDEDNGHNLVSERLRQHFGVEE